MDLAQEIKDRVRISDVLALYHLEPGRAGFIHCPFHAGDRDASLKVYPEQNSWHCFGCGKGGSVIDFVMEMERCGFRQAAAKLDSDFHLGLIGQKQSLRELIQREQERDRRVFEQKSKQDSLKRKVLYRRAQWLKYKGMGITTHEQAQEKALLMAEIERLDDEIEQEGREET